MIKIKDEKTVNPTIVIAICEDIPKVAKRYVNSTDDDMIFYDTGNRIEDVLLTSNSNDLSWFIY